MKDAKRANPFFREIAAYVADVDAGKRERDPLAALERLYLYSKLVDRVLLVTLQVTTATHLQRQLREATDSLIRRHVH